MNKKLTILAVMALVAGLMVLGGAVAQADDQISCGDTLTSDTEFDSDLFCPATDPALIIGADGITINLDGHTLSGPGGGTPTGKGIVLEGHDDVTIKNGKITGFARGIRIKNASGIEVRNIEAFENGSSAVRVRENVGVVITEVNFHDNFDDAIGVSAGSHVTLGHSWITNNAGTGIFVFSAGIPPPFPAARAHIHHNRFVDNTRSAVNFFGAYGTVEHNFIQRNNSAPVAGTDFGQISLPLVGGPGPVVIRCNEIRDGFNNDGNGNAIGGDPLATGASAPGGIGFRRSFPPPVTQFTLFFGDSGDAVFIRKNLIENNPVGIYFSDSTRAGDPSPPSFSPEIDKNTINGNTVGLGFRLVTSEWTVDAIDNFWGAADGPSGVGPGSGDSINTTGNPGGSVTFTPFLTEAQHCQVGLVDDNDDDSDKD